jgi:alpha-galactosidase
LYDIGFDRPEAHAISRDGKMYYAFYAKSYRGEVELRGLGKKRYRVSDYVNQLDYGLVKGPAAKIKVRFDKYLLIEAVPQ